MKRLVVAYALTAGFSQGCRTTGSDSSVNGEPLTSAPANRVQPEPPGAYRLVQPDAVTMQGDGTALVRYSAPCAEHDFESFVGHRDDSGDFAIHVGVVYPVSRCKPGPVQTTQAVLPSGEASGHEFGGGVTFEPIRLGGGGFLAAPVDLQSQGDKLVATFTAPCKEVEFEAYVQTIDDSGNRDMGVGVVFAKRDCHGDGPTRITRTIGKNDPLYSYLGGGEGDPINYVPMLITVVEPAN